MDFAEAIQKHAEWKLKLRAAIARREQLDVATISKDNCCAVGQWFYGDGRVKWGSRPEFQRSVTEHRNFHAQAGKVAALINAARYAEAEAALGSTTPYGVASSAVGSALISLKKAAAT